MPIFLSGGSYRCGQCRILGPVLGGDTEQPGAVGKRCMRMVRRRFVGAFDDRGTCTNCSAM
jgi:hypothetical protein